MPPVHNRIAGINSPSPRRSWRNTLDQFGLRAQLFHTAIGAAVIVMLAVGFSIDLWPLSVKTYVYSLHMGLGLWILLGAALWAVSWISQPTPERLPDQSRANFRTAKLVHKLLLLLCLIMPVTGWIMVSAWGTGYVAVAPYVHLPPLTGKDPDFAKAMLGVHIVVAWAIIGLLTLHTAGALYHHIVKRDPILKRILPRLKPAAGHHRFQFDKTVRKTKSMR